MNTNTQGNRAAKTKGTDLLVKREITTAAAPVIAMSATATLQKCLWMPSPGSPKIVDMSVIV
jgi:hypothetical protein